MNFIKFRWTLYDEQSYQSICSWVKTDFSPIFMTMGLESLNEFGEPAKPHVHIHFITDKSVGAIRKAIQRHPFYKDSNIKGNLLYSLAEEKDVKDICRFFRYAWKQGGRKTYLEILPPEMIDIVSEQEACAKEEYAQLVERNLAYREKQKNPTNFDKLMEYMEEVYKPEWDDIQILANMIEYYAEKGTSINQNTLVGYLNTFKIRRKIISSTDMARLMLKK